MQVILKKVRLSYPDLWVPGKPMNEGDAAKYGGQFIMEAGSPNIALLKQTMESCAKEVFGANWQAIVGAMAKDKKCLRDGNSNLTKDGAIRDGYAGCMYVVARNKAKPLIIGPTRTAPQGTSDENHQDGFPILRQEGGKPYGGCYVNVKIDVRAMKAFDKVPNQIYATLLTVQFVGDGPAFGAASGTAEGFDEVEGAEGGNDLF